MLGSSALILLIVGQGWVPHLLLNGLQSVPPLSEPEWKSKNAIVLLGIGSVRWPESDFIRTHPLGFSRVYEAARLYFACLKTGRQCYIMASGGDPQKNGISEAEVMQEELVQIGVESNKILIEAKSNNTFQNAQFSSVMIQKENFDQIILVTSAVHLRRALLYFSHFGVRAIGASSDRLAPFFSVIPIAHNFTLADIAIHEYFGIIKYPLYNYLGLNAGSSKAGAP